MAAPKEETSIIQIIQEMVKNGEADEKIIQTLKDLGVEPEKAKRLLLVGQADIFALLQSEISKIVKSNLQQEVPRFLKAIQDETKKNAELNKNIALEEIRQKYSKLTNLERFEADISEKTRLAVELSEKVRDKLNELGEKTQQAMIDLQEIQSKGIGTRNRWISIILVIMGILFSVLTLYTFMTQFTSKLTVDTIIITLTMAALGITMLFVSALI